MSEDQRRQTNPRSRLLLGAVAGAVVVGSLAAGYASSRYFAPDGSPRPAASTPADTAHDQPLPAEAAAARERLALQIQLHPEDAAPRKELAVLLLDNEAWVEAFHQAKALQELVPNDVDGLFVEAMVLLKMGQNHEARALLEQVRALQPSHVRAYHALGLVQLRQGESRAAVATWERGLEQAGGHHPELERLLAVSRSAMSRPAGEAPASAEASPSTRIFPITIGLASDDLTAEEVPRGASLFVALYGEGDTVPVAARRVATPAFPHSLTLRPEDSMMGAPLPESGRLVARLDLDGDASTKSGEPSASARAEQGTITRIELH